MLVSTARAAISSCSSVQVSCAHRAVVLGAAPDPLEPHEQHRQPEAWRVRRLDSPTTVPNRDDPAHATAGRLGVGLDRDHHLAVTRAHVDHVHTG